MVFLIYGPMFTLSMSRVGISTTPLLISLERDPPITLPVFSSISHVSSSPASIQISPVFSLIISTAAYLPIKFSNGTKILIELFWSKSFFTNLGVTFLSAGAIISPESASIMSKLGFIPLRRSGKNGQLHLLSLDFTYVTVS